MKNERLGTDAICQRLSNVFLEFTDNNKTTLSTKEFLSDLDVFLGRFSIDAVERLEQLLEQHVLARALVVRWQVVFDRFADVAVQLHDDLLGQLAHFARVMLTRGRAERHHVLQCQTFRLVIAAKGESCCMTGVRVLSRKVVLYSRLLQPVLLVEQVDELAPTETESRRNVQLERFDALVRNNVQSLYGKHHKMFKAMQLSVITMDNTL